MHGCVFTQEWLLIYFPRSGIGGGGFMTVRIPPTNASAKSEVYTIDFRETAPALANTTMYTADPQSAAYGGLAVGVPGEVKGLEEAHRRWGTLPWKRLVEPSISLAAGWEVDRELGKRIPASFYPKCPRMISYQDYSGTRS